MATSSESNSFPTTTTLCDYLKIRFTRIDGSARKNSPLSGLDTWKDYKRQWIVMSISLSPLDSYLTYCTKEEDWLVKRQSLQKLILKRFKLTRNEINTKNKDHLELEFEQFTILFHFASLTKLQQWGDELEKIRCRTFSELVRCPQHPEREAEYIMEICPDRLKLWNPHKQIVAFEWKLQTVRRAQYHNKSGKVEIEVGRATETGEGNFYFIGHEMKDMFYKLKASIALLSKSTTTKRKTDTTRSLPSQPPVSSNSVGSHSTNMADTDLFLVHHLSSTDEDSSTGGTGDSSLDVEPPLLPPCKPVVVPPTTPPAPSTGTAIYSNQPPLPPLPPAHSTPSQPVAAAVTRSTQMSLKVKNSIQGGRPPEEVKRKSYEYTRPNTNDDYVINSDNEQQEEVMAALAAKYTSLKNSSRDPTALYDTITSK